MNKQTGFSILEMIVVVSLMGLIAVMVWPVRNVLDDSQRGRVTHDRIDEIRRAILGHEQKVDPYDMGRVIGGYVGDMGEWPELWEPYGDGTGGVRGEFLGKSFRWLKPYKQVAEAGLESMGQPRGLWTRYLSEGTEAEISPDDWRGPYLTPPVARNTAFGSHYASTQDEYASLSTSDREFFHLLQGAGRLTDGWNRSFRFFITDDPDSNENETIFWIVSLGPNGRATFPTSPDDMNDYDENAPGNQDNIVSRLHERDWRKIYRNQRLRSSSTTRLVKLAEDGMEGIVRSIIGESPTGPNTGHTGDLLDWPRLWNWVCRDGENNMIDCDEAGATPDSGQWEEKWEDPVGFDPDIPFTYGQPRGLWGQGTLPGCRFGLGWRHAYMEAPRGVESAQVLLDPWDRPYHFFKVLEDVNGNDVEQLMVLSSGPSGAFEFPAGADGPPSLADRTDPFRLTDYDPALDANLDNIVRIVRRSEWLPGYLRIAELVVENVPGDPHDNIKCRLFGVYNASGERDDPVLLAGTHGEIDGTTWAVGSETQPLFRYDDTTSHRILSGARYLVCWKDENNNDVPDEGEEAWWKAYSIRAHPARIVNVDKLNLDAGGFEALP